MVKNYSCLHKTYDIFEESDYGNLITPELEITLPKTNKKLMSREEQRIELGKLILQYSKKSK